MFALILFCSLSFIVQNMTYFAIWFANLANMNVGVITVIWSTTPLMVAISEYIFYKQGLKVHYIIGMVLMVVCAGILSVNSIIFKQVPSNLS